MLAYPRDPVNEILSYISQVSKALFYLDFNSLTHNNLLPTRPKTVEKISINQVSATIQQHQLFIYSNLLTQLHTCDPEEQATTNMPRYSKGSSEYEDSEMGESQHSSHLPPRPLLSNITADLLAVLTNPENFHLFQSLVNGYTNDELEQMLGVRISDLQPVERMNEVQVRFNSCFV